MLFLSETLGRRAAARGSCGPTAVLLAKRRRAATEDSVGERDPFVPAPIPEGSHWDAPGAATDGSLSPSPTLPAFGKAAEGKEVRGEDGSRNACCPVSPFSFSASQSLALNRLVIWRKSIVFCT